MCSLIAKTQGDTFAFPHSSSLQKYIHMFQYFLGYCLYWLHWTNHNITLDIHLFWKDQNLILTFLKKTSKLLTLRQIQFCCSVSLWCLVVDSSATNPVPVYCKYLRNIYKRAICQGNGAPRDTLYLSAHRYRLRVLLDRWHCSLHMSCASLTPKWIRWKIW